MSKPQSFKRLIVEDFDQKDRPLVSKLAYSINIFAEDILNALNKKLSIEDNININKKDFTVTVDAGGVVIGTVSLKTELDHSCQGLMVIKADNMKTATNTPTGTPFITFTENSGVIKILKITNLTASEQYKLRVIIF